jgi:hypothetical protein
MKKAAFWDIASCSLVEIDRCFTGAYCLHQQGKRPVSDVDGPIHISYTFPGSHTCSFFLSETRLRS